MSIISIFSKTRNVYFVNVLSMYGILIFYIVLFGQGFAINEINPSYYLIRFLYIYIYIYTVLFFLMNELSY